MKVDDLAAQLPEAWRAAFRRFVDTGEADEAFLKVMDSDQGIQSAVDEVLAEQAQSFRNLTEALAPEGTRAPVAGPAEKTDVIIRQMTTEVLEVAVRASALDEEGRARFVHEVAPTLDARTKVLLRELSES